MEGFSSTSSKDTKMYTRHEYLELLGGGWLRGTLFLMKTEMAKGFLWQVHTVVLASSSGEYNESMTSSVYMTVSADWAHSMGCIECMNQVVSVGQFDCPIKSAAHRNSLAFKLLATGDFEDILVSHSTSFANWWENKNMQRSIGEGGGG